MVLLYMNYLNVGVGVLFTIVCLGSVYYFYKNYKKTKEEQQYLENKEFLKKVNSIKGQFYYFYTKWCPHCKDAEPIFESIKKDARFNKYKIDFFKIDCEDKDNKTLALEYKIKEYPSYILVMNGKKYIYDANLNPESLHRFFKAVYKKI